MLEKKVSVGHIGMLMSSFSFMQRFLPHTAWKEASAWAYDDAICNVFTYMSFECALSFSLHDHDNLFRETANVQCA